jgi:O-antigen/teichoic acid export membrane protein
MLPPAINGIYARLWLVYASVFAAIACFGLAPLILTHTAAAVDNWLRHMRRRSWLAFLLWLLTLSLSLTLFFLTQDAFQPWVAAPLLIVQVWLLLSESYLIIRERFGIALTASVAYSLCFAGIHVWYLQGGCTLSTLFLLIAAAGAVRATVLTIVSRNCFLKSPIQTPPDSSISPAIRSQWMQLGIYDVSQMLFRWIDKVALSALIGPALFAVYLNGTLEVPFIGTLLGAVGNGLLQQMAHGEQSHEARVRILHLSGSLLARIVFPLFFFLFFFRGSFIVFVFSEKYADSVPLFGISICTLLLRAYNYTSILQHLNRVKLINWGALIDLGVALAVAWPLFVWKGLAGVAFAFMISSYIQAGFYLYHTARLLRRPVPALIPWRQWLWMLLIFGAIIAVMHELVTRYCSMRQALFLGLAGTALLIIAALAPFIFRKRLHG